MEIFLGRQAGGRLGGRVLFTVLTSTPAPTMLDSLADYPRWFVVLCATIVLAVLIWGLMKLLKWTLWLLIFVVVVVGLASAAWLFFR